MKCRTKQFLRSGFFALCLLFGAHPAYCGETCYIDHAPLFLYKMINWWYDSLPGESGRLCGRPVKCINDGSAHVEYDASSRKIQISIKGGFANMLAAVKVCRHCFGPSHWQCTWFDRQYFSEPAVTVEFNDASAISGFVFHNINKKQARRLQRIGHGLIFVLEGVIGGLANGRIALHASGDLIKRCPGPLANQKAGYPMSLTMKVAGTNDILAKFSMIWEH